MHRNIVQILANRFRKIDGVVPVYISPHPLSIENRTLLQNTCESLVLVKRPFGHILDTTSNRCLLTYQTPYELNYQVVSELGNRLRHEGLTNLQSIDVIKHCDTHIIRFLFHVSK